MCPDLRTNMIEMRYSAVAKTFLYSQSHNIIPFLIKIFSCTFTKFSRDSMSRKQSGDDYRKMLFQLQLFQYLIFYICCSGINELKYLWGIFLSLLRLHNLEITYANWNVSCNYFKCTYMAILLARLFLEILFKYIFYILNALLRNLHSVFHGISRYSDLRYFLHFPY